MTLVTKAITVQPPWAQAIAIGAKLVENRGRDTRHRGLVAIHCGRRWSVRGQDDPRINAVLDRATIGPDMSGALIAVAELVDCHPYNECCQPWGEAVHISPAGKETRAFHLVLEDVRRLATPVPVRGQLAVPWTLPEPIEVPT